MGIFYFWNEKEGILERSLKNGNNRGWLIRREEHWSRLGQEMSRLTCDYFIFFFSWKNSDRNLDWSPKSIKIKDFMSLKTSMDWMAKYNWNHSKKTQTL